MKAEQNGVHETAKIAQVECEKRIDMNEAYDRASMCSIQLVDTLTMSCTCYGPLRQWPRKSPDIYLCESKNVCGTPSL